MATTHYLIPGSERVPMSGSRVISRANENAVIQVTLKLRRRLKLPELTSPPEKHMTREELAATYGASPQDIEEVGKVFKTYGLDVIESNAATRTVKLSGPIKAVEAAFQVTLFNYAHEGGNYRGRVGHVYVP